MDVAGAVEEEEARAGEGVAGSARGDVSDADVVVRGADVGDELKLVREGLGNGVSCRGGADGGEVETVQTEDGSRAWNSHWERHLRRGSSWGTCFWSFIHEYPFLNPALSASG